jgi:hypothetical protein
MSRTRLETFKNRRVLLVQRLRSGEYQQARNTLHDDSGFCCLGVACDVFRIEAKEGSWKDHGDIGYRFTISGTSNYQDMPEPVRQWYGFTSATGSYRTHDLILKTLSNDNDFGQSFAQIADIIESEPENLFLDSFIDA